ncbi:hypothetical protein [Pseudomonas monteilii]|uniref:hypothetical protein n=1 Tax=Pseudomonas monteilii TaxID=76759 RepID=UPI003D97C551
MLEQGSVVATVGNYQVVEVVETYLDDTTEVVGYVVIGPGSDSSWIHPTLEAAKGAASDLDEGSKSKSRMSFRP